MACKIIAQSDEPGNDRGHCTMASFVNVTTGGNLTSAGWCFICIAFFFQKKKQAS